MSLVWDLKDVDNWKELCWVPSPTEEVPDKTTLHYVTSALVWSSMLVGFSRITEKNARSFYRRMLTLEHVLQQSWIHDGKGQDIPFTFDMVEAHIGLSTNVTELSNAKFNASIIRILEERIADRIKAIEYVSKHEAPEIGNLWSLT